MRTPLVVAVKAVHQLIFLHFYDPLIVVRPELVPLLAIIGFTVILDLVLFLEFRRN
jgi:hypothetical protein